MRVTALNDEQLAALNALRQAARNCFGGNEMSDLYEMDWAGLEEAVNAAIAQEEERRMICKFDEDWIGECKNALPCEKHSSLQCVSCGEPATHSCPETGQFVCGSPLCEECEHAVAPDGTNGNIGFFSTIPEELKGSWKSHVKKKQNRASR